MDKINQKINKNRRNLLKIALFGGGAIVAGKILTPIIYNLVDDPSVTTNLQNFKTVEDRNGLTVYDKDGQEIFTMDNGKE